MLTFKHFINEANYMRFLKKNKNLTDDQREMINKYYTKTNTQAGSKVNWQSRIVRKWDYEDFEKDMMKFTSGRKATFKKPSIPGTKGEDYWEINLRVKGFYAAIPLTQETATFMNSSRYGCEGADYCIGWSGDVQNWDDIVIGEQQVPIYITNGGEKWVVMIYEDNREYDIWDKMNNHNKRKTIVIPGFDIKKNLLTSQLKDLYDELREDFFDDGKRSYDPWEEARDDFEKLVYQIERAHDDIMDNIRIFDDEMESIKDKTLNKLKEKAGPLRELSDNLENEVNELEKIQNSGSAPFVYNGNQYSEEEFNEFISDKKEAFDTAYEAWSELDDQIDEIDDMEINDMPEHADDYEWEGNVPDDDVAYEQKFDTIYYPSNPLEYYEDLREYLGGYDKEDELNYAMDDYIFRDEYHSAEDMLRSVGIEKP